MLKVGTHSLWASVLGGLVKVVGGIGSAVGGAQQASNASKQYTVRIGNSSGITRKVFVASGDNQWEWTLAPGTSKSFRFRAHSRTLFYMRDYASGTGFDIYGGRAPSKRSNDIELYDREITVNGRSYSHVILKRNNGL
ncbi:unnamed protein product [Adineta steineri]|uniref:Uncharacterized protein n=1 Tax=Adineta steineri TaxID=433720 RepID=A0A819U7M5_9BILA|nr:unnamed protein product [Adineta steineri]CAF4091050.1 unnamed protein product [Adineta steineri]